MLGKLLKYEWKSTWRVGCLMLLGLVLVTFFGWLSFQAPLWQSVSNNSYSGISVWDLLSFGTLFMYIIMLVGLNYGIIIYMGVHFYKTMYTDEGYLTHTLPVTKHQILVSKILNSGIWVLLVILGIYLSVTVLVASMIGAFIPEGYTWGEVWNMILPEWDAMWDKLFRETFGMSVGGYFGLVLVMSVITPFTSIIILFGAISIGQLFTKHRVLMAIVSYIGILIINSLIGSAAQSMISVRQMMVKTTENALVGHYLNFSMLFTMALSVIMAVLLYIVSYYVTSKKLNME